MFSLNRFIIVIFLCTSLGHITVFAKNYIPSPTIFLHGMNTEVNFNVAPLFTADPTATAGVPMYDTVSGKFKGAFYDTYL